MLSIPLNDLKSNLPFTVLIHSTSSMYELAPSSSFRWISHPWAGTDKLK